jgi:hypothetical protein
VKDAAGVDAVDGGGEAGRPIESRRRVTTAAHPGHGGAVVAATTQTEIGRGLLTEWINPSSHGRSRDVIAGDGVARLDADTLELASYFDAGGVPQRSGSPPTAISSATPRFRVSQWDKDPDQ